MLKRRREIKELSEKKDEFAGKLQLAQMALKKTEEQLANVLNDFEGAQKRKIDQEIKVAELRKDAERAENEVQNALAAVRAPGTRSQKTDRATGSSRTET
ncbi:hypothetical protein [Bdellovibrio bacteriovorus]|uniref:hypothetical protein n=1 Tax=Bdellovibrio bacteriovorus TaxID=959 RepID=UPI0035A5F1B7